MKIPVVSAFGLLLFSAALLRGAPDPNWLAHDRERPLPAVVNPGTTSTQDQPGKPPSDAVLLFDGKDLTSWVAMDGSTTKWVVNDGALECVPGSGYVRTLQSFGDCQLHVEWAAPVPVKGDSQGRGNSGVFLGFNRYEIQVLDSYENKTYADGSAASYYGEYPPLVNACRPPGQWQTYDIIWTNPQFDTAGKLLTKARITVIHNGVLVQNNIEVERPNTGHWFNPPPYQVHPERLPIAFQDHGNPVRYRNIWVRELRSYRHKEFMLPNALLDSYVGDYPRDARDTAKVRRLPDGLLSLTFAGGELAMHAASPTHFYAEGTDVQCKFEFTGDKKRLLVTVGEDFTHAMAMERSGP